MKKTHFCIILFFLSCISCFSLEKEIVFPVEGFLTPESNTVNVEAKWNENWFGEKSSKIYNHNLARICAVLSEVSYVDVEKSPKENALLDCYKALGVSEKNIELHYILDSSNSMWGNDQCAFSFAFKEITGNYGKKNLVFVVVRGTPLSCNEWISNLNISDSTEEMQEFHEGFLRSSKQLENAFIAFLLKNKIDIEDCFLLITGHSRGGGVANLFAMELYETELFKTDNIYAYTFACPNVTSRNDCGDEKFSYIWNIVNAEDLVTFLPMNIGQWKYGKYGQIKTLVNSWNVDETFFDKILLPGMNEFYSLFLKRNFSPFKSGPFFPVQVATIISTLNESVHSYYSGITSLRNPAESAVKKIFPETFGESSENQSGKNALQRFTEIARTIGRWIFTQIGVDMDNFINSIVDMHSMEGYLSCVLSAKEYFIFSEQEFSLFYIESNCDAGIFDEEGICRASILDGSVNFSMVHPPVAASSILPGTFCTGFPGNGKFYFVLSKESLIPTSLDVKHCRYSSSGKNIYEEIPFKVAQSMRNIYVCKVNESFNSHKPAEFSKTKRKDWEKILSDAQLQKTNRFGVSGDISFASNGTAALGVHAGLPGIYGSLLIGFNTSNPGRSWEIGCGIGNRCSLIGKILLDSEFYANVFMASGSEFETDSKKANLVPDFRFTASIRPRHNLSFYAGLNLELHISGFNDAAFDSKYRFTGAEVMETNGKFNIIPNVQVGVKF